MVTIDVELELTQQLKEAGKRLSNPPASVEELLHVLDQTEKLLQKVDQSPNSLMQEALDQPMKALVNESLLEHSNVDVKVSVASCICEITRITAPDAPYSDEEMKGIFKCIVSSFENLSDETSRSYGRRASILDTVCKVRSCVIMLDLECDELIVRMFEHFLNSVRDHHLDKMFSWMLNIMALVIEENEDCSLDLLRPLMASIKNNSEGILPVARKLGEEVLKKSADRLRPFINQILTILGGSLDDYSQVLTSIIKGTTDVVEHNDESASVQPKADESYPKIALSDDAAQVTSNGKMVTENEAGSDDKESKKSEEAVDHQPEEVVDHQPEEVVDHPDSNLTSKLDINESVAEVTNVESKQETTSIMQSTVPYENKTEKLTDILFSVKKRIRSKKKISSQTDALSSDIGLTKAPENTSDSEMRSPKRARKKTPKVDDNKPLGTSDSDDKLLKKSTKKVVIVDSRSKKKSSSQTEAPSTDIGLIKAPEITSDTEVRSPKRTRKKTPKAVDYKTSATSGSDVEISKKSTKKADTVDSGSKKKSSSQTDATEEVSDSGMRSPKSVRKKTPKAEDNKPSATSDSDDKLLKKSTKKVDSGSKPVKRSGKKVGGGDSVAKKRKLSGKKESEPKKPKLDKKVGAGDSEVKPTKQSLKKDNGSDSDAKPLKKLSGKKRVRSKRITKPSKDIIAHKDEETDSDDKTETDSDNQPISLSAKKGNKSSSSMVKSSSKNKLGKKQVKFLSEDDGMDVSLKSALKSAKREGNLEETLSTTSKRKRSVGKKKVIESVKYDDSLVGEKVKVWWPKDKMYYEGVIVSFDAAKNKHKVLYLDEEEESLTLKKEKWEIIKEYSEAQSTDILSETAGESKVDDKSKDTKEGDDEVSKSVAKNKTEKIVYKSRGRKGNKSKTKTVETEVKANAAETIEAKSPENVMESEAGEAVEGEESEKKA